MNVAVRPSEFAQDEIEYYLRRYESERAGLGDRLWNDIQAAIERISTHPQIGETVRRTRGLVRRVPLRHFPFFLIYRERETYVQIVAGSYEQAPVLLAFAFEVRLRLARCPSEW